MTVPLLTYQQVLDVVAKRRPNLLLGNGFSIACDAVFEYPSLFEYAVSGGLLTDGAKAAFEYLGTSNFEGVLRLLSQGAWLTSTYCPPTDHARILGEIEGDKRSVKTALIESVTNNHLARPQDVLLDRRDRCVEFLRPYLNVFTTNYDLLLYWVLMRGIEEGRLSLHDGFRNAAESSEEYLVFKGDSFGVFYLHGALHIWNENGEVRKLSSSRSGVPLVEMITDGLDADRYPLFIAEGEAENKREQIDQSAYLSHCFEAFGKIRGPVVVFGSRLAPNDSHITDAIVGNWNVEELFVGLRQDPDSEAAHEIINRCGGFERRRQKIRARRSFFPELQVRYFDARTTPVWDDPAKVPR